MTRDKLKKDLLYLAKIGGLDGSELDDHIDFCIDTGMSDFWNGYGWSWCTRPYELTITAAAEEYELPSDFRGIRTVREKSSTYGGVIIYVPKEQFDTDYPKPMAWSDSYPMVCTAYRDNKRARSYIKFMLPPSAGYTIYIDMYTKSGTVEAVPEGFESGLLASIEKYLYKPGSNERFAAQLYSQKETSRLQNVDSPFVGHITDIFYRQNPAPSGLGRRPW